jgi:predicted nucleic acid-binding protein
MIGTFTLLAEMDLLFALFAGDELRVTPAVYTELVAGLREGRQFLQPAVAMVESGRLSLLTLTAAEVVAASRLPASLNAGEAESISLCQARGAALVTNDRRARNFCRAENVEVFDLIDIFRALWKLKICSKQKVRQLVADIENKERMVIKRQREIFAR